MRGGAGLHADETRCKLLEKGQNLAAPELPASDHIALRVDAVHLKDRLSNIQTNRRDRLHAWLLRIAVTSTATTSLALACRWRSRPQHQNPTFSHMTATVRE